MSGGSAPARPGVPGAGVPVDVSVVVTSWNEEKYLPVLLESIRTQNTRLRVEVIVVDDSSADASAAIATEAGAHVLSNANKGNVPAMRNLGLAEARGAAVLFADADVAFSEDYVEQMAGPIVDGRADVTLCFRHMVLESSFPVLPASHSRSYAWLLRHIPAWWFVKVPLRLIPWLGRWVGTMLRERRACTPFAIPDRVNTPAVAVRTGLAREIGGWKGPFGSHEDTRFCEELFARTRRVLWRVAPVLYVSARRTFPRDARWIPRLLFAPLLELLGLAGLGERRTHGETGYRDPAGRR